MELVILFFLGCAVLGAWIAAISLFISAGKAKGYKMDTGILWYIGILATPLAVGLYVSALPDKRPIQINTSETVVDIADELPSV